ncbi:52 kDa repressor of the inhibitor of the protein kinase [Frankliniella fusca]|uniref:52 kDa repressor of the inhibitor of the protein kinase n=1 Tax=Frankliniella fusca TaxID=407009 RepID=A0AAE1LEM8_9NEOP|nr:52 kDa repressor of the inhibitor of the protein kinase [Frankliniella fusca]
MQASRQAATQVWCDVLRVRTSSTCLCQQRQQQAKATGYGRATIPPSLLPRRAALPPSHRQHYAPPRSAAPSSAPLHRAPPAGRLRCAACCDLYWGAARAALALLFLCFDKLCVRATSGGSTCGGGGERKGTKRKTLFDFFQPKRSVTSPDDCDGGGGEGGYASTSDSPETAIVDTVTVEDTSITVIADDICDVDVNNISVDGTDVPTSDLAVSSASASVSQTTSPCGASVTPDTVRWASSYDVGFYRRKTAKELDDYTLQQLLENPEKKGKVLVGNLVKTPLKKFAKLTGVSGDLQDHAKLKYHLDAVDAGKTFLLSVKYPNKNIHKQLDSQHSKEIAANRERLMCSLDNILFLGRQGLALRGHRESMNDESVNKGNFLELLLFRKEIGDEKVQKHFSGDRKRDLFHSKIVQNDLVQACGDEITEENVNRVKKLKYYSVLFDETTDMSHTSQLSLSVRYPYHDAKENKITVREDFLSFVDLRDVLEKIENSELASGDEDEVDDPTDGNIELTEEDIEQRLTGTKLGQITVNVLISVGLDPKYCVGIGADGCSVNTSDTTGAIQEIQKTCQNAVRAPCFNHALNLSISKSSKVPAVKTAVHVIKAVGSFFRASSKRHRRLLKIYHRTLPTLCETRWVQRHEAVQVFLSGISEIIEALESISKWQDGETAGKAKSLLNNLLQPEFLVTLVALQDILATSISLSRFLQKETIELQEASDALQDTLSVLEEKRRNSDEIFGILYNSAEELTSKFGVVIPQPRGSARGRHPTTNAESYYRQTIYNPMLDNIIQDLNSRFTSEVLQCYDLNCLLPLVVLTCKEESQAEKLTKLAARFSSLLDVPEQILLQNLKAEMALWKTKWRREKEEGNPIPKSCAETLEVCDETLYPNIRALTVILQALPSSVATSERSFSTLRRIKTWLRSTMNTERLSGLALLNIHRDIQVNKNNMAVAGPGEKMKPYGEHEGESRRSLQNALTVCTIKLLNSVFHISRGEVVVGDEF